MKLLTLTGPSCSGKTTLLNKLVAEHGFKALVSCTTRPPRKGEEYGKDYYFISDSMFELMKSNGSLMENVEFNGYKYGLSVQEVQAAVDEGKNPVVIVEPNGLKQITEYCNSNCIGMYRLYIGGELENLMKRYLQRSADEDMSVDANATRHARRLSSLVVEQATWAEVEADAGMYYARSLYNTKITEYTDKNEEEVIKLVKELYGQG